VVGVVAFDVVVVVVVAAAQALIMNTSMASANRKASILRVLAVTVRT
jgi:hypothetical protein